MRWDPMTKRAPRLSSHPVAASAPMGIATKPHSPLRSPGFARHTSKPRGGTADTGLLAPGEGARGALAEAWVPSLPGPAVRAARGGAELSGLMSMMYSGTVVTGHRKAPEDAR